MLDAILPHAPTVSIGFDFSRVNETVNRRFEVFRSAFDIFDTAQMLQTDGIRNLGRSL